MTGRLAPFSAVVVAFVFALVPRVLLAQDTGNPDSSPPADRSEEFRLYTESMDQTDQFIRDFRATLDRTAFDMDALLDSLDYDADSIIEFVRTSISFEQYPGVLRGPKGTLLSRAGNSIDQALLLAKLLRDAGYDARIAGAELDAGRAMLVLKAMKQPVQPAPPFGDAEEILSVFERHHVVDNPFSDEQRKAYVDYVNGIPTAASSGVAPLVKDTAGFVHAALSDAGIQIRSDQEDAELINEASRYHWVQYRDAVSDPWVDVHPLFLNEDGFPAPEASTYISDEAPDDLLHRFRFQAFIERKTGGRLETVPITAAWERPVANLVGVPLTFSNLSDTMMRASSLGQDPSDLLESSKFLAPIFGDSLAEGARYFDLRGSLVDPLVAQSPGADFFSTIGSALSSAIGEIGDQSAIPTMTAQWLEFTFISPDGRERVFRRTTFDRIGAAARRKGEASADLKPTTMTDVRPLIQLHTFMVGTGAVPRGYVLDYGATRFEAMRDGVDELMNREFNDPSSSGDLSEIPVSWANSMALLSVFGIADTIGTERRSYRSGPGLAIHRIGLGPDGGSVEVIDIVANPRRAIDIGRDTPVIAPGTAIQAGIFETAVEGVLLSGSEPFDTWQAFDLSEKRGAEPIVFQPGDSVSRADLPMDVQAAIKTDLENGYAVVSPGIVESVDTAGWWRVNLQTGETLGQLHDGRGSVAEWLTVAGVAYSGVLLGLSLHNCAEGPTRATTQSSMACCSSGNTLMTFITFGAGQLARAPALLSLGTGISVDAVAYNIPIGEYCESRYGMGRGYR